MKRITITGILTIALSCPAFADISANAPSAKCDNGTLETYQGESTLQAQWDANTINLKWYTDSSDNNGTEITPTNNAAATCTYDDAIVLPTNTITKPGYTFAGWRVRTAAPSQPQQTSFDLSTIYENEPEDNGFINDSRGQYGANSYNDDTYGLTEDQTWAVGYADGSIVKGIASCNNTAGADWSDYNNDILTISAETYSQSSTGQYCCCRATSYTPLNGVEQTILSSPWVFHIDLDLGDENNCAHNCASVCADNMFGVDFRRALFGITE